MGSQMEHDYQELRGGAWAHLNPSQCPCRGHGWLLSDLDTHHKCPVHGAGVPHPENEEDHSGFDAKAHTLGIYRRAAAAYRDRFVKAGGTVAEFKALVVKALAGKGAVTPARWVDIAMEIAEVQVADTADERAVAAGYSCDLERRLEEEAMWERKEREIYG